MRQFIAVFGFVLLAGTAFAEPGRFQIVQANGNSPYPTMRIDTETGRTWFLFKIVNQEGQLKETWGWFEVLDYTPPAPKKSN